jgi:hypothetical protein
MGEEEEKTDPRNGSNRSYETEWPGRINGLEGGRKEEELGA